MGKMASKTSETGVPKSKTSPSSNAGASCEPNHPPVKIDNAFDWTGPGCWTK